MRQLPETTLWLGNVRDANDFARLFDANIVAVVQLAVEERTANPPRELVWLRFPLLDGAGNPPARLRMAVSAVTQHLAENVPMLVSCSAGMSRAPAIAAAALATLRGECPDDWLPRIVKGHPHDVSPALWSDVKAACWSR